MEYKIENLKVFTRKGEDKRDDSEELFRWLCTFHGDNGKSICEEPDNYKLGKIISANFVDHATGLPYSFAKKPPELEGQIGAPHIVDQLLGKYFGEEYILTYHENFGQLIQT